MPWLVATLSVTLSACSLLVTTDGLTGGSGTDATTGDAAAALDATVADASDAGAAEDAAALDDGGVVLAGDDFDRPEGSQLGSAVRGGSWSFTGNGAWSISGGRATAVVASGKESVVYLGEVSATDLDVTFDIVVPADVDGNGAYFRAVPRYVPGKGDYRVTVRCKAGGAPTLTMAVLASGTPEQKLVAQELEFTAPAGAIVRVRAQAVGSRPTLVRSSAWLADQPEPSAWMLTKTDATEAVQSAGSPGLGMYVSSSATGGPYHLQFDDLVVRAATP